MEKEQDIAYLGAKIAPSYLIHPLPGLVMPVGIMGEYYITYNPNAGTDDSWECGFLKSDAAGVIQPCHMYGASTLEKAVENLELKLFVCINTEDRSIIETFKAQINTAIAQPAKADFRFCDEGLSGVPSLSIHIDFDDRAMYICLTDNFMFEVADANTGDQDAETFSGYDAAYKYLIEHFGVRIRNEDQIAVRNFRGVADMMISNGKR